MKSKYQTNSPTLYSQAEPVQITTRWGRFLNGVRRGGGLRRRERLLTLSIIVPAVLYYLLFRYYPVLQTLFLSLTDSGLIREEYEFVGFENYIEIFTDPVFVKTILNTTYYAISTTLITTVLALLLAFILNPIRYGNNFLRLLFYLPMITSGIAIATMWLWMYQPRFGLFNEVLGLFGVAPIPWLRSIQWAMPSLIIMAIWGGVGYSTIIFIAGLRGIPIEFTEAAIIDGASTVQVFWYITLPMLGRVISFVLVTGIIGSFQVFQQVYLMTRGGPLNSTRVIALSIYDQAFQRLHIGVAASMAFVLFIIVTTFTVVQMRLQRTDWEL